MVRLHRKWFCGLVGVAMTAQGFALSGCSTLPTNTLANANDVCAPQRAALENTRSYFDEDMLEAALFGAALGAGAALVTGKATAGRLIGGAAIGAFSGGFFAKLVKEQGRDQALDSALGMTKKDAESLAKTQAAMDALTQCRRGEVRAVNADYKAKRITKPAAQARLADIRTRMDEDFKLAQSINDKVSKRNGEYVVALDEVKRSGGGKKEKQFAVETASVLTRCQGVGKSTQAMVAARAEANDVEEITLHPWGRLLAWLG